MHGFEFMREKVGKTSSSCLIHADHHDSPFDHFSLTVQTPGPFWKNLLSADDIQPPTPWLDDFIKQRRTPAF